MTKFAQQFAADVDPAVAELMAATQRPITEKALNDGLVAADVPWRGLPSWHIWGSADLNIPAQALQFMADRAGARAAREIEGGSHALGVSQPGAVAETILEAYWA